MFYDGGYSCAWSLTFLSYSCLFVLFFFFLRKGGDIELVVLLYNEKEDETSLFCNDNQTSRVVSTKTKIYLRE